MAVPPVLEPRVDADGRKHFDLTLRSGERELLPGKRAETWGVNGGFLGPTIRVRTGDRVAMHVSNHLPESSTLHWHGMPIGILGDHTFVNGTRDPHLTVTATHTRLRILNGSNARIYYLGFTDDRPFQVVGTDSGLLPAPVDASRVVVSPGERIEIVVARGRVAAPDVRAGASRSRSRSSRRPTRGCGSSTWAGSSPSTVRGWI